MYADVVKAGKGFTMHVVSDTDFTGVCSRKVQWRERKAILVGVNTLSHTVGCRVEQPAFYGIPMKILCRVKLAFHNQPYALKGVSFRGAHFQGKPVVGFLFDSVCPEYQCVMFLPTLYGNRQISMVDGLLVTAGKGDDQYCGYDGQIMM